MGHFLNNATKSLALIFIILLAALAFLGPNSIAFPSVPSPSSSFDCDDSALAMYRHFESLGIESTPIIGNLKMDGEDYMESNHVWLLVKYGNGEIAYDWGTPRFDRQHYEGYEITIDMLLSAVEQDRQSSSGLAAESQ